MPYVWMTVKLRTPPRFDDYAFRQALSRLLWNKLGCDPKQTGCMCGDIKPATFGDHEILSNDVSATIRLEAGKLSEQKLWEAVTKYLQQNAGFAPEEAFVRDITTENDIDHTEL